MTTYMFKLSWGLFLHVGSEAPAAASCEAFLHALHGLHLNVSASLRARAFRNIIDTLTRARPDCTEALLSICVDVLSQVF